MGFLRGVGKYSGKAAGFVIGGAVNVVGDVTGIKFLNEVGDGVKSASEFAGDTLGQAADGVWNTASGFIQNDENKKEQGLSDMGDSVSRTAKGVYQTAKHTYGNGKDVYTGFKTDDDTLIKSGLSGIVKTVAIGALAVGAIDMVDGVDIGDPTEKNQLTDGGSDSNPANQPAQPEVAASTTGEPGTHSVEAHWVDGYHRADGTYVEGYWRDGDGNTAVDQTDGYIRSNPDETESNPVNHPAQAEVAASTTGEPGTHSVEAHWVEGYHRADGTYVEGYWRDGDGNTAVDQTDGYTLSNPDVTTVKNLNS
ncbi:hypothetical protein [Paenisporosarcina sp.]|uniref:hypothetical protein n=1 Tax=Paenisporosarcina sp. TaxID=1932001 RepID=UPI003C711B26